MPVDPTELLINLGAARDQGARPTCLSFSLSEIHRAAITFDALLSPESLHRQASARAKKAISEGLAFHEATDSLNADGQATEKDWPYHTEKPLNASCTFHRIAAVSLPFDHTTVIAAIKSGLPIGLIIDVDLTFFGYIGPVALDLTASSQVQGRHAVVICGFRPSAGSFDYLVKNSWGGNWGVKGYAWLTSYHISARSPFLVRI